MASVVASSESAAPTPLPSRVGPYEPLARIASGGMATVFLARKRAHAGFERLVALKIVHPHLREIPEFVDGLLEEAKLAGLIHHPRVVPVLDAGDDPNGPYLVMEYVEGDSLSGLRRALQDRRGSSALPPRIALRILDDAMSGLDAAHTLRGPDGQRLGLVHRDFSPQNILVGVDGHSRLTDFGIAKAATRVDATRTGIVKGKPRYMAPEQVSGQPLDIRCDVWAAAVVLWEALTGRRLFDGDDLALALRITTEEAPSLRSVMPEMPPALDKAIASALTMAVDERCPNIAELRARVLEGAAVLGGPADPEEVAELVKELAASTMAERRAAVSRAEAPRERVAVVATKEGRPITPPSRRVAVASFALLGLSLVAGAVAWTVGRRERAPVSAPAEHAPPADVSAMAAPSALASEPPAVAIPVTPPPPARFVSVSASTPIRALRLGDRVIPIGRPTSAVIVQVATEESHSEIRLAAVAIDGRRAMATVAPTSQTVRLDFGGAHAHAPQAPHGHPVPSTSSSPSSAVLMPSPYARSP